MSFQIILILVCFQSIQDAQIAEWATRAFLLYGGSPTATVLPAATAAGAPPGYHPSQLTSFHEQASFHPGIASTPGEKGGKKRVLYVKSQSLLVDGSIVNFSS